MGKKVKLRFHFQGSAHRRAFFVSFSSQIVVLTHYTAVKTKRDPFKNYSKSIHSTCDKIS